MARTRRQAGRASERVLGASTCALEEHGVLAARAEAPSHDDDQDAEKREKTEHARCVRLALGDVSRAAIGEPQVFAEVYLEDGRRLIWYRWPDGTEVGPAGPFTPPRRQRMDGAVESA